jgi:hypothetical protein
MLISFAFVFAGGQLVGGSRPTSISHPNWKFGIGFEIELPMLFHVAANAQGHEILERVIALLAPLDLVMNLKVFERSALLAFPLIV